MDKQMIEEMAQCKNFNGYTCKSCGVKNACDRYILAEELYNAGYRKIPENAVVVPDMAGKDFYTVEKAEWDKMVQGAKDLIREERKETAEKFAESLKESKNIKEILDSGFIVSYVEVCKEIDEICEEFTEGEKCQE